MEEKKICVLFPGIGYTVDRPLLYYPGKYFRKRGYEVINVSYSGLPGNIGKDEKLKRLAFDMALVQAKERLTDINWREYSRIVFVGKSIGTIVAAAYARERVYPVLGERGSDVLSFVYLTPLSATFDFAKEESGVVFHGTGDPWVETEEVEKGCDRLKLALYKYDRKNHSLESGYVMTDIETVQDVMSKIIEIYE